MIGSSPQLKPLSVTALYRQFAAPRRRSEKMSAIQATTSGIKDLSDGTLRISFDISPIDAQNAYALFGARGSCVAIAALTQQATTAIAQAETIKKEPVRGLALLAVRWCKEPDFWEWINQTTHFNTHDELGAKKIICLRCGIKSRNELNTDTEAAAYFERDVRKPYMKWLENKT